MSQHTLLRSRSASPARSFIEPLETRIAPALLVNGANLLGGIGNPTTGETSSGENAATLVTVSAGQALVWYDAATFHIMGISVGPGANLQISGDVFGDVIANLTANGRLSDSDGDPTNGEDGGVLLANNILGIKTSPLSDENGDIVHVITAGSISNLQISGQIQGIYAGDGVFRTESTASVPSGPDRVVNATVGVNLDINPLLLGVQSDFHLLKSNAVLPTSSLTLAGSITTAVIQTGKDLQIFSGNGFSDPTHTVTGGAGGGISGITIQSAFSSSPAVSSYTIISGDGGMGKTGGAGGSITKIIEKSSNGLVSILAGNGGDGSAGLLGTGGAGGSISLLDAQSDSTSYTVTAGHGGNGSPAGAGGSLIGNNFSGKLPSTGILLSGDFTGDNVDDVLVADAGSGQMVLMQNSGDGSNFTAVEQDPITHDKFIQPKGTTPSSAVAADVNNDGFLDVVVSYRNSNSIGIFLNDGNGVFTGSSLDVGQSPTKIAAGNFSGTSDQDIAVLVTGPSKSKLLVAEGDGTGIFTLLTAITDLGAANATDMKAAPISVNSLDDLFVSFRSGKIDAILSTGAAASPFTVTDTGAIIAGAISNIDVDADAMRLLALTSDTKTLSVFTFSTSGLVLPVTSPDLTLLPAKPLVAQFIHDHDATTKDDIAVLSSAASGSQLDVYHFNDTTSIYDPSTTSKATVTLKNFAVVDENGDTGIAALGGSLGRFSFSQSFADFTQFSLPFSGKSVNASAGDGGMGLGSGKGGLGGSITGINIEATDVALLAGDGGDSVTGGGGAGGGISNSSSLTTAGGISLKPQILADQTLDLISGNGGTPSGGLLALGGAGGAINGMSLTLTSGDIHVATGHGGDGHGALAGAGGGILNLTTTTFDGSLHVATGFGGNATSGIFAGAAGGAVSGLTHTLKLSTDVETLEKSYDVTVTTGNGGTSAGGIGGAAGAILNTNLTLDPANFDTANDSTVLVSLTTGNGGSGATGGAGGAITGLKSKTIFDEITADSRIAINHVAMQLTAGFGGDGSTGAGGAGGGIGTLSLAGVVSYDADALNSDNAALILTAGDGGNGATIGGVGGSISAVKSSNALAVNGNVVTINMLTSAAVTSGNGGNGGTIGGAGGGVTGTNISVQSFHHRLSDGSLSIVTGNGGNGGTIGGAGGGISASTFGSVDGNPFAQVPSSILTTVGGNTITGYGVLLGTGHGGNGVTKGGAGGSISTINVASPQDEFIYSTLIVAGKGGDASGNGALAIAGAGGSISGIQSKDLNSALNVVQAGDGGSNPNGVGGHGGNITSVKIAGFIGRPTGFDFVNNVYVNRGVFDNNTANADPGNPFAQDSAYDVAQGLFAGRGGAGSGALTNGIAGAVSAITARQISAIAATVDSNHLFGLASLVTGVKTDLIGFEVHRNNIFEDINGEPGVSPSGTQPVDGFILAKAITLINTLNPARTAAFSFTT